MGGSYKFAIFAAVCLLSVEVGAQQTAALPRIGSTDTVRLVTGPDYPPFTAEDLTNGGVLTELTVAAFRAAGVAVTFEIQPWRRGFEALRAGQFDATFPYISTRDRRAEMVYSEPLMNVDVGLYTRPAAAIEFRGPEDLARLTLCVPIGYALSPRVGLLARSNLLRLHDNHSPRGCMRQVELGRVDAVILPRLQAQFLLQNDADTPTALTEALVPVERRWHFLIAPKSNPRAVAVVDAFNQGREILRTNGQWERIVVRHLGIASLNWTRLYQDQIADED